MVRFCSHGIKGRYINVLHLFIYLFRQSFDAQLSTLDLVRSFCMEEKSRGLTANQRRAVIDRVFLSLVRACSCSALNSFYTNHIAQIMNIAEANITKVYKLAYIYICT